MTTHATPRLVTALVVTVGGLLLAVLAGRAEAAVVVMPWVALLVLGATRSRRASVQAQLVVDQDRVAVGQSIDLEVALTGLDGGWVEAEWRPTGDGAVVSDVVRADGRADLTLTTEASTWGTHDLGHVDLRHHRPYGLTVSRGSARRPLPVRVHPRPIDLRRLLAPWFVRRLTGAHRSRSIGRGIEYADLREFGPGDSPRDINWRASARSEHLLVSERHPDRSTHAILLLDSFADADFEPPVLLGQAIEAAVALAESHLTVSDRVGLIDLGGIIRWVTPGSGRHQLARLVDILLATRLYASEAQRSVATVPPRALPNRSLVIALSPLRDPRFVESLYTLRAAGHDVGVVELTDEQTDPAEVVETGDPGSSSPSRLALRLWRAERAMERERLIGHGVAVVTHRPIPSGEEELAEPWEQILARLTHIRQGLRPLVRT